MSDPQTCHTCGKYYCSCVVIEDMYDDARRIPTRNIEEETGDE